MIFLFLRSLSATVIPSITVPLALVGTLALMYVAGFSVDNLSLMGLSIAVGFVVDDAIVMLENIQRHVEERFAAGFRPHSRVRVRSDLRFYRSAFLSWRFSFRCADWRHCRPHLPRVCHYGDNDNCRVSIRLADADAGTFPRFLKQKKDVHHNRIYLASERMFACTQEGYRRSLDVALRFRRVTLAVFLSTVALSGYLFVVIPKGFFPIQDTGFIIGTSEASQDISFAEMSRNQLEGGAWFSDPAVASVAMLVGAAGNQTQNNGRMFIALKPLGDEKPRHQKLSSG